MDQGESVVTNWMVKAMTSNSKEETAAVYDDIASVYEQDLTQESKPDPEIIAKELEAIYKDQKGIRILDLAAGTGYVGYELKKLGFTNIDALDGSARMLEIAKSKQYYQECICAFFTAEPTPGIGNGTYDALVSTGSFEPGHLKADCIVECLRVTKPGGHIVVGSYNWCDLLGEKGNQEQPLQDVIQALSESNLCKVVKMQRYEKYSFNGEPGTVFIVKKL